MVFSVRTILPNDTWYMVQKIAYRTVVWVANREIPLTNFSGAARVNNKGTVLLLNDKIFLSSNITRHVEKPIAQLLDTGNLVLKEKCGDTLILLFGKVLTILETLCYQK